MPDVGALRRFLAGYWFWIALPGLLLALLVVVALLLGEDRTAPLDYVLF